MRSGVLALVTVASTAVTYATTLDGVCTSSYVQASLPSADFYTGITIDNSSVSATPVYNTSVSGQDFFPDATFDYCNVSFAYTHNGRDDQVLLWYWLPAPEDFQNRFLATGGGGFAITSGSGSLPGGIIYGAAAGTTDGGFGSFSTNSDTVFLIQNGTVNWEPLFMFGYQAIHEMTVIGKELTKNFFNSSNTKLYTYYQGCSEGGRDGWSQVQRFGDELDGAITGAPAFRFSHQQTQHLYSNIVEQTMNYYPPPCELELIVNETIAFCDPLDGKTDGVVARSDLCKLHFNINSTIGKPYYCAATAAGAGGLGGPPGVSTAATPAQNGTVTAQGAAVAAKIIDGLRDLKGRRVYLSYQPAASFADAQTQYDNETNSWVLDQNTMGGEWVARYLELLNSSSLATLDNVTYDTLKDWIYEGWQIYEDTLQTTWPDLTPFNEAGAKVLHFHGEADNSIPTASSVRYWNSVRQIMYPGKSFNDSATALNDWYRLFLVPGAAHCGPNTAMPNGPFPQTNLAVLIDWVEKGVVPMTLNATVLQGDYIGENQQICAWPSRPLWTSNTTNPECVYDQASIDTWLYDFDAFKMPTY